MDDQELENQNNQLHLDLKRYRGDEIDELAKQLFIKSYVGSMFLTDQTRAQYIALMKNSFEVAELFIQLKDQRQV